MKVYNEENISELTCYCYLYIESTHSYEKKKIWLDKLIFSRYVLSLF